MRQYITVDQLFEVSQDDLLIISHNSKSMRQKLDSINLAKSNNEKTIDYLTELVKYLNVGTLLSYISSQHNGDIDVIKTDGKWTLCVKTTENQGISDPRSNLIDVLWDVTKYFVISGGQQK